jgi:hypothetical protein
LIGIDDIELLIDLSMSSVGNDVSIFLVNTTLNIEDLSSLVGDLSSLSLPELPPS